MLLGKYKDDGIVWISGSVRTDGARFNALRWLRSIIRPDRQLVFRDCETTIFWGEMGAKSYVIRVALPRQSEIFLLTLSPILFLIPYWLFLGFLFFSFFIKYFPTQMSFARLRDIYWFIWLYRMFGSSRWILVLGVLAASLSVLFAQIYPPPPERLTGMNPCISKQTCHEYIQTPHCAWCAAPVSFNILIFYIVLLLMRKISKIID